MSALREESAGHERWAQELLLLGGPPYRVVISNEHSRLQMQGFLL